MTDLQSTVEKAIRETLQDPEGAGSDLSIADDGPGDVWLYVEGNLDVQHLASHMIDTLEAAGAEDGAVEMEYAVEETQVEHGTSLIHGRWSKWLENVQFSARLMTRGQEQCREFGVEPMYTYRVVQRPKPEPYTYVEED